MVTTTNLITELKPGATELMQGSVVGGPGDTSDRVVLAFHRYGKGRAMVLGIQGFLALADGSHRVAR